MFRAISQMHKKHTTESKPTITETEHQVQAVLS